VELEAAGCEAWYFTPRSYARVAHEIDQLRPGVFTKAFWRPADGKLCLRIGHSPNHVVAQFGDWIIRHPDGRWSVHAGPAADGSAA
jgi:hypothetical protein